MPHVTEDRTTTFTREDSHTRMNGNSPDLAVTTVTVRRAKPAKDELSVLRERWMNRIIDLVSGIPPQIPPLRMINHEIKLIDPDKQINYRLPKCPDALKEELANKISCYTSAGWWVPTTVQQAVPMLCVLKKSTRLRTVFDLCLQNENMVKDVSPFLDQDTIRNDVARAAYRSKLDMSEAYEQICVRLEDVPKTAFSTIYGTFISRVMQQGDCNTPSTFQRLMTAVFHEYIVRFVHVYLDDIFIYSSSIDEHEGHLSQVFDNLRSAQLYLSRDKVNLYSQKMDCLGHVITKAGIQACTDKMQKIWDWRQPHNYHDVQRFSWTRSISSAFPARYYCIHIATVDMYLQWQAICVDS